MKKIAVIGLLALLLYNMFGLAAAILLFDNQYKMTAGSDGPGESDVLKVYMPSLPYTSDWENNDGLEGLIKTDGKFYNATSVKHTNDTLYVTIKANQAAHDHFFELADKMQSMADQHKIPESGRNKAMKVFDNLLKNYIANHYPFPAFQADYLSEKNLVVYPSRHTGHAFWISLLQTPPPEAV